jgi:hypothetical protein
MQTNAPAGSEFVDQFNRAVVYGQIPSSSFPQDISRMAYGQVGTRAIFEWKNIELVGKSLYHSFPSPTDSLGQDFVMPSNAMAVVEFFNLTVKSASGAGTTSPSLRLFQGGTTINVGNAGTASLQLTNSLATVRSTLFTSQIFSASTQFSNPGKVTVLPGLTPQLVVVTAEAGGTSYVVTVSAALIFITP